MEENKNKVRGGVIDGVSNSKTFRWFTNYITNNEEINCDEIINNFKSMLENSSAMDKIRSDNELSKRVCEIYGMIKDKHINE